MKKRTTTFTKGSGCYECVCCHRMTRDDGNGDSVYTRQCTECYEYGGLENVLCDYGIDHEEVDLGRMEQIRINIVAKGGTDRNLRFHLPGK